MNLVHTSMHQIVSDSSQLGRSMVRRRGKQNGAEKERIMMRKSTKTRIWEKASRLRSDDLVETNPSTNHVDCNMLLHKELAHVQRR